MPRRSGAAPSLLRVDRLIRPLQSAESQFRVVAEKADTFEGDSIELKGVFVLGIAALEHALLDSYAYVLRVQPAAYRFDKLEVRREELFTSGTTQELYEKRVQLKVRKDSYRPFRQNLQQFLRAIGVDRPLADEDAIRRVVEAKATRNLLIHGDLTVSPEYLAKAGPYTRAEYVGQKLNVGPAYVRRGMEACSALVDELIDRITEVHVAATKEAVLRRVWEYLFASPVMRFEDFWDVSADGDILSFSKGEYESMLSNSEKMFLSVWRHHFNSWRDEDEFRPVNMRSLDAANQRKMLWFLSVLPSLALE